MSDRNRGSGIRQPPSVWTVSALLEATKGELLFGDPGAPVRAISTDTRTIGPEDCFVALPGEVHDGHRFIAAAVKKGARSVILSADWPESAGPAGVEGISAIRAADTQYALGELARFHRRRFSIPVVAVTGSNGKTSTKEMLSAIFACCSAPGEVLKNKGNYNNLIGLPLTLLELGRQHRIAVVEMGINVPGEMERLAEIGAPDAGIITNVQPAHLEGLESLDRILEEKGKLWTALGRGGLAVVNLDDPRLREFSKAVSARKVTCSLSDPSADVRLEGEARVMEGETVFRVRLGGDVIETGLPLMGLHHVQNALAAAAAAWGMGAAVAAISDGLSRYVPVRQRMHMRRLADGAVLIDDTYNANPGSMLAAIRTVAAACAGRPFVAALGEMRELGPQSPSLHRELGRDLAPFSPALLVTCGELGREIGKGAVEAGLDPAAWRHAQTHEEAVSILRSGLPPLAWVLVKGSRGMTMEKVVEGMLDAGC